VVEEFAVCVLLWVEKVAEVIENVVKKIVDHDATLYRPWKSAYKFIVFLHLSQAVVGPVVLKVVVDLVV
jgi:hypothetical protein